MKMKTKLKKILVHMYIDYTHMFSSASTPKALSVYDAYPNMHLPSTTYQSNNKYSNFPPMMNDGRSVQASWQPCAVVNEIIRKDNNIQSNWQYRRYLVENAEDIKSHNFKQACNDVGYYVRNEHQEIDNRATQPPKFYESFTEPVSHRGSSSSDLKDVYLTREQLQAKQVIPSMTQAEIMKTWKNLYTVDNENPGSVKK
jgi:hypothetical protein